MIGHRARTLRRRDDRRAAAMRLQVVAAADVAKPTKPLRDNRAVRRHVRRALIGATA